MSSWRKPALPTIHNTQTHLLPLLSYKVPMQKKSLEMRIYIVGMLLMSFCDKYSCVKQDLFHIAVSEHVMNTMFNTKWERF